MTTAALDPHSATGWHWRNLLLAPHRLGFFLAMVVLGASGLWWLVVQMQRSGLGPEIGYAMSPTLVHSTVMTFGFLPLFFSGFLFTAGPKWLGVPGPSARALAPVLGPIAGGWLVWLAGSHVHTALAAAGLLLAGAGILRVTVMFWRLIGMSRAPEQLHAKVIGVALIAGCACLAGIAVSLAVGRGALARAFVLTGLWSFVVAVYVTVAHRMIPFFTSSALPGLGAWRPGWVLGLMLGVVCLEAAAPWVELAVGMHAAWQTTRGVAEIAAGAVLVWLAFTWGLVQSLKIRLLAMLHLGFLWLGLGLVMSGATQLLGAVSESVVLPLAPLHAITMGCLGSLMMAMVTRVSCGHSGRSLVADNLVWTLFWLLQLATFARIAATLPGWPTQALLTAAALVWAVLMLAWGIRYGSWYGRERADGRTG